MTIFKTYKEILEYLQLKQYNKIVVSGFQRSGTTFCAWSLSQDLKYNLVDEACTIKNITESPSKSVIQAPQVCQLIHEINMPNSFIIFMSRNCLDVIKSANRLTFQTFDNKNWNQLFDKIEIQRVKDVNESFVDQNIHSCYNKHNFFLNYQMHNMQTEFTIFNYESLKDNHRFLQPEYRKNFHGKQISLEGKENIPSQRR